MIVSSDSNTPQSLDYCHKNWVNRIKHAVVAKIQQIYQSDSGTERHLWAGRTVLLDRSTTTCLKTFKTLMLIALILMMGVLYLFFKQKRGVLLPFGTVVMSIIVGWHDAGYSGWTMTAIWICCRSWSLRLQIIRYLLFSRYQEINTPVYS